MKTYIRNGTIVTPEHVIEGATVIIEKGKIIEISSSDPPTIDENLNIDAKNLFICPGFIDIHFHGALGKDTMDADGQALMVCLLLCFVFDRTSFHFF